MVINFILKFKEVKENMNQLFTELQQDNKHLNNVQEHTNIYINEITQIIQDLKTEFNKE